MSSRVMLRPTLQGVPGNVISREQEEALQSQEKALERRERYDKNR